MPNALTHHIYWGSNTTVKEVVDHVLWEFKNKLPRRTTERFDVAMPPSEDDVNRVYDEMIRWALNKPIPPDHMLQVKLDSHNAAVKIRNDRMLERNADKEGQRNYRAMLKKFLAVKAKLPNSKLCDTYIDAIQTSIEYDGAAPPREMDEYWTLDDMRRNYLELEHPVEANSIKDDLNKTLKLLPEWHETVRSVNEVIEAARRIGV